MDTKSFREKDSDLFIDLESGRHDAMNGASKVSGSSAGQSKELLNNAWGGFIGDHAFGKGGEDTNSGYSSSSSLEGHPGLSKTLDALVEKRVGGEERARLVEKNVNTEKPRKKCKKPPKPPRPPKSPYLDAAEQKLAREISELAMLKRARIERMKALKDMKNAKQTSSNSSLWALVITVLFCLVILWQGMFSKGGSSLGFQGSPVSSSVEAQGSLISVQFYRDISSNDSFGTRSAASPDIVEQVSNTDDHGNATTGAR